jgi:hypothetical protein
MIKFVERYNGKIKATPLSAVNGWSELLGERDTASLSPTEAYNNVATVFCCVEIRAGAVASMPLDLYKRGRLLNREGKEFLAWQDVLRNMLVEIEENLCLFGRAYIHTPRNGVGFSSPGDFYLPLPHTISIQYAADGEIAYFVRSGRATMVQEIPREEMTWMWYPSKTYENHPGGGPLHRVLGEAATMHNIALFSQQYFRNGAISPTLFFFGDGSASVPYRVTDSELSSFQSLMRRVMGGIKNAFKIFAFRGNVSMHTIGAKLSESGSDKEYPRATTEIVRAFRVPKSLVDSETSTYAHARADIFNLYDQTVLPHMQARILGPLNDWLALSGLRAETREDMLECYQQYELQKAQAVSSLVGGPVWTVNEGRAYLGNEPLPGGDVIGSGAGDNDVEAARAWKAAHDAIWSDYP